MPSDILYLLTPGEDPAYPGETFYCPPCAMVEGVLASFPELAAKLDVRRVDWPRPRKDVVAVVGEENQSLPMLLLEEGTSSPHQTGTHQGRAFINDRDDILAALTERHGFPRAPP
ncbi:DUF3088 domain-containing protein [Henriciella marina]|uniref:DUF3088 domain-containing protein n=1 Tax=Henriciella marina TaxID=453851 RepID=A0ABT4LWH5_9PROT|nr:DUF3088 domain-containing protein [Henriciella marina]MCZ4298715.1 DUF3088 domain-containing protein [Henriciella marina]